MAVQYTMFDVVFSTVMISTGIVSYVAWHHAGVVGVTMLATAIWCMSDLCQTYRLSKGHEPVYHVSSIPQGPDLPVKWYVFIVAVEMLALFAQLIIGYTLISCVLIVFLFGGVFVMLHLLYFSGSTKENAATMLPTVTLTILAWLMCLTAPMDKRGHMGLSHSSEALWLIAASPIGAVVGYIFILFLGVQPKDNDYSTLPIMTTEKAPAV